MPSRREPAKTDYRNQPAYPLSEAARYLRLPVATLRSWTLGRQYPTVKGQARFRPLIRPAGLTPPQLSFWNLIEAHVLKALRTDHGVSIDEVRQALEFAERRLEIDHLLLRPELRLRAGQLFLDRYGELINLSASGQLAMKQMLENHLRRVTWDDSRLPIRLRPFLTSEGLGTETPIAIDPSIAFGRPVILSRRVSTAAIVSRIDAGESPEDLAADYDLTRDDIDQAVLYERAA